MAEKLRLLESIRRTCLNYDLDPLSHMEWEDMSVEQLRTVVILLEEEMVRLHNARNVPHGTRGHCYLLEFLYYYVMQGGARNPMTQVPITALQRHQIMTPERVQLLEHIGSTCYNFGDPISLMRWEHMPIQQLRTVALLLNDEMVTLLNARRRGIRGHCYLLEYLYQYVMQGGARNPVTGQPITAQQRQHILAAHNY
jgi:hypothetical protein